MKYIDIALTVAIVTGVLGSVIASVSAYYSFTKIGEHTKFISEKVKPLSQKLTKMDFHFATMSEKMDNIKITDTIHTRVVGMPDDTINARILTESKAEILSGKPKYVKHNGNSIDPN